MSQQGRKRSRSYTTEEIQAPVKISRHEVQSSEEVQQELTQLEIPEVADELKGDNSEEVEEVSDLRKYDDDGLLIIRPPPNITNWRFGVKEPSPPPLLTEEEREVEELWEEMDFLMHYNEDSNSEVSIEESSDRCTSDTGGTESMSGASSSSSG